MEIAMTERFKPDTVLFDETVVVRNEEERTKVFEDSMKMIQQQDPSKVLGHAVILLVETEIDGHERVIKCLRSIGGDLQMHQIMLNEMIEHAQQVGILPQDQPMDKGKMN
jgi:hypothetical protein